MLVAARGDGGAFIGFEPVWISLGEAANAVLRRLAERRGS
jgi:hypothetical protein